MPNGFKLFLVCCMTQGTYSVELGHQSYNPGDMDGFFKQFSPDQVGQRPVEYDFDGGS